MGNDKKSKLFQASIGIAAIAAISFITYKLVSSKGHIPALPQVTLEAGGAEKSILDTASRASTFQPTDDEKKLISMLEQLHLAETGEEAEEPTMSVEKRTEELKAALSPAAKEDLARFLVFGDYLAVRFHSALKELLSRKPSKDEERSYSFMRVTLFGGAFYTRAKESGLIAPDHMLKGSKALPEILFRYRWRLLGGVNGTLDFSNFEQKALFDFIVRFVGKQNAERRIQAASELSKLDNSYDAVVAKALILLDAGQKKEAAKTLERAVAEGRSDSLIQSFLRAVERR